MGTNQIIQASNDLFAVENFIEDNEVTPENFEMIIAEYKIKDVQLKCCLSDTTGKCGQIHQNGYLVRLKDSTCTIMGGTCGKTKFNVDNIISKNISLFKNERNRKEKLDQLLDYVEDFELYEKKLDELKLLVHQVKVFYQKTLLLNSNLILLNNRYKSSKASILINTYVYDEEFNLRLKKSELIGYLKELNLFDGRTHKFWETRVHTLMAALRQAREVDKKLKSNPRVRVDREVNRIAKNLEGFKDVKYELDERLLSIERFKNSDLSLLLYLSNNTDDRLSALEFILDSRQKTVRNSEAYIKNKDSHYCRKYQCDEIKIK